MPGCRAGCCRTEQALSRSRGAIGSSSVTVPRGNAVQVGRVLLGVGCVFRL